MELKNIKIKDIKDIDTKFAFFHYTNMTNLENIDEVGLLPKIGDNATGIEKTEKIFFAIGDKGVFSIMDSWIRWLIAKRLTDLPGSKADIPFYRFCSFVMHFPILSTIANFATWIEFKIKPFKIKSFKIMKDILDTCVFFALDLEEEKDFSYQDIDEVKSQNYNRKTLKKVYAKMHKIDSKKMDYWNMHTLSNVSISTDKITLIKKDNSYKGLDILLWMVKNTKLDLKVLAPYFYEFLKYYKLLD